MSAGSNHYFLDGELHMQFRVNRGKDLLVAWKYSEHKKVTYNYTWVQRNKKKAYNMSEVAELIGRSRKSVEKVLEAGGVPRPQHSYSLETGTLKKYWWSEQDIMGLLDYYASLSRGRPRKDGVQVPSVLPTPRELRAKINNEEVLYVKRGDVFVPTYIAREQ